MAKASSNQRRELNGVLLLAAAILLGIVFYIPRASTGVLGDFMLGTGRGLLGVVAYALPVLLAYAALEYLFNRSSDVSGQRISHVLILMWLVAALLQAFTLHYEAFRIALDRYTAEGTARQAIGFLWRASEETSAFTALEHALPGGLLGGLVTLGLQRVAGNIGAIVILIAAVLVELILIFNISVSQALGTTGSFLGQIFSRSRRSIRSALSREVEHQSSQPDPYSEQAVIDHGSEPSWSNRSDEAAAGFHRVGGTEPEGKMVASAEDKAEAFGQDDDFLSRYARGDIEQDARDRSFSEVPILSYDPAVEKPILHIGDEPEVPEKRRSFDVPEFLRSGQNGMPRPAASVEDELEELLKQDWDLDDPIDPQLGDDQIPPWVEPTPPTPRNASGARQPAGLNLAAQEAPAAEKTAEPGNTQVKPDKPRKIDEATLSNRYGKPIRTGTVQAVSVQGGKETTNRNETTESAKPARQYKLPPTSLLDEQPHSSNQQNQAEIAAQGRKLEDTLASFGVEAKVVNITTGPAITRFELTPGPGVKVSRIVNLADDIALNLAAIGVRIEAPIPGKSAIGIEISNKETTPVALRPVLESREFREARSKLTVALARDIPGAPILCDLAKMPHLLIAGATGSGKSVCINVILTSLLYRCKPDEVKLLLIDPKIVELSVYNGIPHLLAPVVTSPKKAANTLNWAVVEMTRRYDVFAKKGVRDLPAYNQAAEREGEKKLPQIVIVIDELSDLMQTAPHEVEDSIARLTAMARAAGMHLIIATQRPSVDVVTGVIKANIPSRIAFMVSSQTDSRVILDMAGAEKLLGKGDMLYAPQSAPKPIRGQGAFITEAEVERVVSFWQDQNIDGYDEQLSEEILSAEAPGEGGSKAGNDEELDELFDDAVDVIVDAGYGSVSILQRRLNVGYPRAGKLIDTMEQKGYIGPFEGSKPRKLLIDRMEWERIKAGGNSEDEDQY